MKYFLILIIFLTSCSLHKKSEERLPIGEIYQKAMMAIEHKKYEEAAQEFEKLQREYPFSHFSVNAHIMEIYSYYLKRDFTNAILCADNFILLHPAHPNIEYVYYIKAISYYEKISDIKHDQNSTYQAKLALIELINKFPDSAYAKDAKIKLDLVNDHLAGYEMEIGRYYLSKQIYSAAINRFMTVIREYNTSMQIEEALFRMVEIYYFLNLKDDAQKYAAILRANYPESKWYKKAYNLIKEGISETREPWYNIKLFHNKKS